MCDHEKTFVAKPFECISCKYFHMAITENEDVCQFGLCRKNSPVCDPTEERLAFWPEVHIADWCGEYEED